MTGLLKQNSTVLRPKRKATLTGFLLACIIGALGANFINNPPNTWYGGYIKCRQNNQTMLNWGVWEDGTTDLKKQYPIWLYGFEVRIHNKSIPISDKFFKLDQLQNTRTAYVRCEAGSLFEDYTLINFEQAHIICQNHTSGTRELLTVNHTNLDKFKISSDIIKTSFWTQAVEVGTFLNSEDLIVHCLMLNHHGELRKDNCTKSYSSVCVNATVHNTIQYSGHESKVPNYDPTSSSTPVTSSAGTSEFVTSLVTTETNDGVDLTTSVANKSSDLHNSTSDHKSRAKVMEEKILIPLICVGVAVVTALVVAVICCFRIKRKSNKDRRPTFSDGNSKTADSVNIKDAQHYEVSDISEYATPSYAVTGGPKTARPRSSIIEGEYDAISNSRATDKSKRQVAVVKAYSHVVIVPANQRRDSDSNMENAYDVSTLNNQTTVTILQQDGTGNVYGHLGIT
ncbi:uncharacterized protein LOC127861225 isoform X1 [Dreissena polymorpha]|uniref:uncharacterized protein LOC127861225 isoform X1 n=1 Tax=Dreissena polymorpha TaxID=45954 RepID=UPI002264C1DF|nr:uncharacterized protein LOC127861225 isoform X1 [Dreissena polymorpha]XP_052255596.1 uncharacterized protein LOC127861225 isoform X1 [Dreissena polymorpha]